MRAVLLAVALAAAGASAGDAQPRGKVGTIEVVTGRATRAPGVSRPIPLRKEAAVYLGDTLRVQQGQVSLRLNDGSLLLLDENSELRIDQASFQGLTRERFSATLLLGSAWAKVKKALAGSERNFEVSTERAVAGVRGTEFRVDVGGSPGHHYSLVTVFEGSVYVRGQVKAPEIGNVAMLDEGIQSPDAVPSRSRSLAGKAMAKKSAGMSRDEAAPSAEPGGGAPPMAAEMAAPARPAAPAPPPPPPPAPPDAAKAKAKTQERSLELSPSEAVFVGEDDDWRPMKPAKADRFAAFARRQK